MAAFTVNIPVQALLNGNMEGWAAGTSFSIVPGGSVNPTADSWSVFSTGNIQAVIARSASHHSGSFSMSVASNMLVADGSEIFAVQAIPNSTSYRGKRVTLSGWFQFSADTSFGVLSLEIFGSNTDIIAQVDQSIGTSGFQYFEATGIVGASESGMTARIRYGDQQLASTFTFLLDDVSFTVGEEIVFSDVVSKNIRKSLQDIEIMAAELGGLHQTIGIVDTLSIAEWLTADDELPNPWIN